MKDEIVPRGYGRFEVLKKGAETAMESGLGGLVKVVLVAW
jgi:hypothetical protein